MKKLFFLLISVCFAVYLPAQTVVVFQENFESTSVGLTTTADSAGFSTTNFQPWAASTHLYKSGVKADSNILQLGKTIYLTSNSFSTIGKSYVLLEFAQICKLYYTDGGIIQVSIDGGTTWTSLIPNQYLGSGNFILVGADYKFSESAYTSWNSGDTLTKPNNTWWKNEMFNISSIAANQGNVKVRFKYTSSGNTLAAGRYGWLLDDVKVTTANNELIVPTITFKAPIIKDTMFVTGPFTIRAYVKDSSGLGSVNLLYHVNAGADISLPMVNISDSTYTVDIPSYAYDSLINYKIQAADIYTNTSFLPAVGYQSFLIKKSLPSVQIGNTTTNGLLSPIYVASATDLNLYSYNVMLFNKTEIQSGGTIESLAFSKADVQGYSLSNASLRIYLKGSAATSAPTTYAAYLTEKNTAIKVYENTAQNLNTVAGWQTFVCNTGSLFSQNGNENLMVFVEWYRPGNATGAIMWNYNNAPGSSSIFYGTASTPTVANVSGQRANMKINFQSSNANNDATVLNFASPAQNMTGGISVPVTVRVKNLGTATLTKAKVHWMVDGVYQGFTPWTGSLQQDFVGTPLLLGSVNLTVGPHVLKAWTVLPNDSIDQTPANDSTSFTVFACQNLNGSYTVGGPTSNFPTFNDMFLAINNCGIAGPVTFRIASGTYNQQLIIPSIPNVTAVNPLTFESESGNKNDVIFQFSSTGTTDNFVLRFDACRYVKVKNMTFKALGGTYGRVAEYFNTASYNILEGCQLEMPVVTSSNYAGIYSANTLEQYNTSRNNTILNGYYGIYNYGNGTAVLEKGNVIEGNTITGFYYYGIYSYYQDSVTINSNTIENGTNATTVYGIYTPYNDNLVSVSKNKVYIHSSAASSNYGIYIYYSDNTAAQPGVIANNFISQSGTTGSVYGLANYYSTYQNYYYNSVNVTSGSLTAGYAFYATGGSNVDLYNNNFVNTGGGYAYYISLIASIVNSNYNNLYATGTNVAYWSAARTNLAALQAVSGKDLNSVSLNPNYVSVSNLHTTNFALGGIGTPIAAVTNDIDGDVRANPPCIGADEFIVPLNDAGITLVMSPSSMITTLNQVVKVRIKNYGVLPLTSATIKWYINGVMQTPFSWTGNLATNASDSVTLGNYIFSLGQNSLKVYSESPNHVADIFNFNDTLSMSVYGCIGPLSGAYTIGGLTADYPSVNAAILAIKNCGVSGPTVFNINPGTYTEQFIIPKIPNASAINTITFKSANNDSSSVIFNAGNAALGNFVAKFDSAQYVKLNQLTLKNEITTGRVIEISGNSKYCEISNSVIQSLNGATSSTADGIYSYSSKDEYITIKNNKIYGGYYGIYMYGVGSAAGLKEAGNTIQNNLVKDFYYYGIYAYYQDSLKMIGNTIQNSTTSGTVYGLYSGYADNSQYLRNNVHVSGSSTAYCMYLYYNNATSGIGMAANNFISQSLGVGGVYGLYNYYSNNMTLYNNSVNVTKGSTSAYAFYITGSTNCNLLNNIFSNTGGGYAYYASTTTGIVTSNYNDLYATGTNLGYWAAAKTNLAALQAASGKDANSISIDPVFFSTTDLHTENVGLFAKGTSVAAVTDDYDLQARAAVPCIGADEFVVLPNDARIKAMYTLGKLPIQSGAPHSVKTIVKNMGSNKLYNLNVSLNISGNNTFTNIKTIDSIAPGIEDTINFDAFTPIAYGLNNVKVSVPADDNLSNNEFNYRQDVTDSIFGYADTAAATTYLGFNTGSGLFVSKYHVNGSRTIQSARVFITKSNTIGQILYGVVLDQNGVIMDTSIRKTITAADTNTWVSFNFLNPSATTTTNSDFYIGIAQTVGSVGYYPLGCQDEVPCRKGAFYYTTTMTGGSFTEATQYGRFMIEANLGYPANKDAAVATFITPISGCGLANEAVKINIINVGLDTIFGGQNVLTAHYALKHNGNLVNHVSQTVTDTLNPSQLKAFTFTTPVNLAVTTADSNYSLIAWVDLALDPFKINDSLLKIVVSKFTPPTPIVTTPVNIAFATSTTLTAVSNDSVYWYSHITDSIPLASGYNFTTPVLFDSTTYWVAAGNNISISGNTQFVGPPNTSIGSVGSIGATSYKLIFDVLSTSGITIKNVDVYPLTASTAFVMVIRNSAGIIIQTYNGITTTSTSAQTINVNFQVPYGTGYTLGFTSGPSFYRNSTGATYPYTLPGLVSITGNSFTGYPAYYYNAYNWEVSTGNGVISGCQSPRAAVKVNVATGRDARLTQILSPNTGCGLSNQVVTVRIKNKGNISIIGSQNVLTASYGYKVNNTILNIVSQQVPNTIVAGDSLDFSFTTLLTLPANTVDSIYTLVAWNSLLNDLFVNNDTTIKSVKSRYTPLTPIVANQTIPYGSAATFNVGGNDSIYWFAHINDTIPIASGFSFTTPLLYDTTTYWVKAGKDGSGDNLGLTAVSTHSGGGVSTSGYGPELYNNGVIPAYGTSGTYLWGWTTSNGWIEYTWPSPISFNKVVFYKDLRAMTSCTFQYWDGTNYVDFLSYNNANAEVDSIIFPTVTSSRLRFNTIAGGSNPSFREIEVYTSGGCSSPRVAVTATVSSVPALDLAATQISEPIGTVTTGSLLPVKVIITNYGSTTITSAILKWKVNGVVQANVPWSGSLTNGQSSAPILLGNYAFSTFTNEIKVWTSNPNGNTDMYPVNDTVSGHPVGCLTGNFTIGVNKNFPNFTSALNALNTAGICGNVVFLVDSGTYNERLLINPVSGMGPNTSVTFTSANGDSTDVVLHHTLGGDAWAMKFNGSSYFKFSKMTLSVAGSSTWSRIMELANSANHIEISNCIIEGIPTTSTANNFALIYASGSGLNNNTFKNNVMKNGSHGIYLYGGSSSDPDKNNVITGNSFKDFYYYGVYLYYQDSISLIGNTIQNASTSGVVYGLYSYYSSNYIYAKNKMNITGTSSAYCFYLSSNNVNGGYGIVANNFISQSIGAGAVYGIYLTSSSNLNIYNNSVNITGGTASYYAFYISAGTGNNIVNNIFSNTGGGYAYYASSSTGINTSNYNDLYATGVNLGYWGAACTNLAAFKAASGKDQNSISVYPNFFSLTNLHLMNFELNAKATPLTQVTDDIDGDLRNLTAPDMGADEFNLPPVDAGMTVITSPISPINAGVQPVKAILRNFGANNLTAVNIQWSVNGILQPTFAWTGNLVSIDTITVTLGNYNFAGGMSNTIKAWTNLPNGIIDVWNLNDTTKLDITVCSGPLSGNYTIGGAGANFSTVKSAVLSLQYCGISGPVTFNVNPGYYNEQFVINAITGASAMNRVTFQSANGDSSSVVIGFDFNQTGNNYVVQLEGTQYLTLKGMTFRQTNSSSGRVITFTGNPSNIIIANNRLEMPVNTAGTTAAVVTLSSDFGNDNKILNNYILNGYNGIVAQGSATVSSKRNVIEGNSINGFYFYGIQAEYQDSLSIRKNSIEPSNTTASKRAIYLNTPSNNLFIEKNKIKMLVTGGTMNGIYITTPVGTSTNRQYITNNFISINGSLGYGMYISTPSYMTIAYNSLNVDLTTTGTTATALFVNGGSNNLLFNNSIVGLDSTYLLYVSANTIFTNSDNNNLYKSGGINYAYWGASAANLAALKVLSAKDSNSVAVDPDYISFADLHVYTAALNNLGKALTDITGDIDGQIRNTSTPDIGADEFAPLAIDVATVNFIEPLVSFSQTGLNMNVIVRIKNYGADSIANFNVVCKLGNAAPVSQPYTSFLHANQADTITFANQTVASGPFEIKVYISLASDLNHMNDTIKTMYFGVPFKSIPYAENFDNTSEDWFVSETASLWERGIPNASVINTAHSAPNVWATNLDGNYTNGSVSVLYTPIFDNSVFKADTLKFWHWEDAELNKDGGYIEYKDNTGNWTILGHIITVDTNATNWYNGTTQNMWTGTGGGWQYSTYKLSNLINLGNTLQFRFVFIADATNSSYNGWAIDNFELTLAPIPKDAGVTAITSPSAASLVGDLVTVSVNVKNFGTDTLTNIPVKYQVTGSGVLSGILAGPLSPGATANYTFTQPYQVANTNYTICAFTSVVGDIYIQNDNKCKTVIVNPALKDVAVTEILQPGAYVAPGTTPIKVVIKNFGTLTQTSIPVSYQRGALTPVNAIWTGNLTAGDTVQFTFAAPMNVPSGGSFSLCAYTTLINDAYIHNDTICKSVIICNVATAGPITGPTTVTPGSSGNAYSITALVNATTYNWVYTPSTGVTIIGNGSSVTINFGAGAVNGVLSVNGVSTACSGASSSINIGGLGVGIDNIDEKMLWLGQNIPNPTTGLTNIEYSLPSSGDVKFDIINIFGQKVFSTDEKLNAGKHFIDLNVNNLSAGIYYYAIEFKGKRLVKKMVVNK